MRYEWDPQKDVLNQRKHGLRLKDGIPALEDPQGISSPDDRFDYSEERMITLGLGRNVTSWRSFPVERTYLFR